MSANETLFDKAQQNLKVAKKIYTLAEEDDVYLNYVAYHLQQAVEMTLKYYLEENGINYPKTHDIDQLIRIIHKDNVPCPITEYIDEHSEMFSLWESKTRYVLNYQTERRKIERALEEVNVFVIDAKNSFLKTNGFINCHPDELNKDENDQIDLDDNELGM
ncbi:HEPN domain-containing protein [Holdemania massiliensis]|uniref:HEPN domain-containing protein n=1 Tax=Holdemania massiliensis TaxID=1468449 RepID=UPI001F06D048|nr:HEPN domain-containing protein [Holdemania massiliensis]MCH1942421.1 HEPN domain-containing protein [Holdemania massiliensis]